MRSEGGGLGACAWHTVQLTFRTTVGVPNRSIPAHSGLTRHETQNVSWRGLAQAQVATNSAHRSSHHARYTRVAGIGVAVVAERVVQPMAGTREHVNDVSMACEVAHALSGATHHSSPASTALLPHASAYAMVVGWLLPFSATEKKFVGSVVKAKLCVALLKVHRRHGQPPPQPQRRNPQPHLLQRCGRQIGKQRVGRHDGLRRGGDRAHSRVHREGLQDVVAGSITHVRHGKIQARQPTLAPGREPGQEEQGVSASRVQQPASPARGPGSRLARAQHNNTVWPRT